ncbi:hypothetical protein IW152_002315 [Coemansia sp. BCRC 34962]|nr:hypothetical protein IW152_002315 [Coemansia sp. BCRC 34962]
MLSATIRIPYDPHIYGDEDRRYDNISHVGGLLIALMTLGCAIVVMVIVALSLCVVRKIRRGKNQHTPTYGHHWIVTQPTNMAYVYPQTNLAFMPPQTTPAFMPPQITAIDMPRAATAEQFHTTATEQPQTTTTEQPQTTATEQPQTTNPTA